MKQIPILSSESPFALLENTKVESNDPYCAMLFINLVEWVECNEISKIKSKFELIEKHLSEGYFAVGWFSYELGYAFETKLHPLISEQNIAYFKVGIFKEKYELVSEEVDEFLSRIKIKNQLPAFFYDFKFNLSETNYAEKIKQIKNDLFEGEVYQINLTGSFNFQYQGEPIILYQKLRHKQNVEYSALLNFENQTILSLSPELFFKKDGNSIIVKPMKGTANRGKNSKEDEMISIEMINDEKTLAENVMIVDLLRNDLNRIAETGSVQVPKLFEIETYQTVLQMTSTIQARINKQISHYELFKNLFPSGSVTGAPKIRAMEIIHALEARKRGLYTGALGYLLPNQKTCLNVSIRTVICEPNGKAELGVGSGIVYDSEVKKEYDEIYLKARFLLQLEPGFELLETLLFDPIIGYSYLDLHLERLWSSSQTFHFKCPIENLKKDLLQATLKETVTTKVRVILNKQGNYIIEKTKVNLQKKTYWVDFSKQRTNSKNILFQHKTTDDSVRKFYDEEWRFANQKGLSEILFLNEKGHVTEGSRTNIIIKKDQNFFTPPANCGLLNGIMRQQFIILNQSVIEKVLEPEEILTADQILLVNSVLGIQEANFYNSADLS